MHGHDTRATHDTPDAADGNDDGVELRRGFEHLKADDALAGDPHAIAAVLAP